MSPRDILCRAATAAGLAGPREDEGLAAWGDECLDGPLSPRGGPSWQCGHDYVIEALDGALAGNYAIALAALTAAHAVVQRDGRRHCECPHPGATLLDALGRKLCVKCLCRQK